MKVITSYRLGGGCESCKVSKPSKDVVVDVVVEEEEREKEEEILEDK